jgi:hypothetical protein
VHGVGRGSADLIPRVTFRNPEDGASPPLGVISVLWSFSEL